MVEGEAVLAGLRLERFEVSGARSSRTRGPAGAGGGVVREVLEVEAPEHPEIVVSYQAQVGAILDERAALVRPRPVPDEIAQAPDGVRSLGVDCFQHGLQRMQISVNVREDRDAHRSRATLAKRAALLVAAAAVWITSAIFLWRTEVPHLQLDDLDPRAYFTAQELARIDDFRRVTRPLLVGSLILEAVDPAPVRLESGRDHGCVGRYRQGPHPHRRSDGGGGRGRGLAGAPPPDGRLPPVAPPIWPFSEQGYGGWLRDQAMSLGVQLVLVLATAAVFMALASWLGRSWWLVGGPALVLAATLFVLAQPLVIDPLFNRFEPLEDRALAAKIEALGRQEGVTVSSVEVADASRRTTAANAYVGGIGPTRRVVLYDTLLDGTLQRARGRLGLGPRAGARRPPPSLERPRLVRPHRHPMRFRRRLGGRAARGPGEPPRTVPIALAVAFGLILLTMPFANAVSRRFEAEADWIALRSTRDPASFVSLEQKLVRSGLVDPDPPRWASLWFGTHPPPMRRIAMAQQFSDRSRGGS